MLKINQIVLRHLIATPPAFYVPSCNYALKANKHWNPKFKKFRALKKIKVELPNFYDKDSPDPDDMRKLSPDEIRAKMKERGLQPPRQWNERQFDISSTGAVFEAYVPPEGDGKLSLVSVGGAKQVVTRIEKKSKSYLTVRKIRAFDEDFDPVLFAPIAQDIYIELHKTMAKDDGQVDRHKIRTLVTETAYPEVVDNLHQKIIKWDFIESLEPPRVVHARHSNMITKDNIFAQLTVRFHTKQILVIYDRFGRICHGNPVTAKDVLEYVVFEKHLSNEYGTWRIHKKIIPDWMEVPPQATRTYKKIESPPPSEPVKSLPESAETSQASLPQSGTSSTPQLATA